MSGAHVHLLLTHIPVVGVVFGILILAYALLRRKNETTQVALAVFVMSGLAAIGVYLTGEGAEESVEHLVGISHALIEQHEEAAVVALVTTLLLGAVSGVGLWLSRKRLPRWFSGATLALALVVGGVLAWTADLGGQINHPEIRPEATSFAPATDAEEADQEYEDDE